MTEQTNEQNGELLPCPFCGRAAECFEYSHEYNSSIKEPQRVGCINEKCCLFLKPFKLSGWNTRTPETSTDQATSKVKTIDEFCRVERGTFAAHVRKQQQEDALDEIVRSKRILMATNKQEVSNLEQLIEHMAEALKVIEEMHKSGESDEYFICRGALAQYESLKKK